jgi:hypothetical protein
MPGVAYVLTFKNLPKRITCYASRRLNCDTKTEHLLAYQNAADSFSHAVPSLAKAIGIAFTEYERLRVLAGRG